MSPPLPSAERLAELIRSCGSCVVLTGAGVSTESGIPDFRSPTGIWARYDPMEYARIWAFRRDPVKVWDFYAKRLGVLKEARPNPRTARSPSSSGRMVEAVITQNIDRLHEQAGSRDVVEVHGSIRSSSCLAVRGAVGLDGVLAAARDALRRRPVLAAARS